LRGIDEGLEAGELDLGQPHLKDLMRKRFRVAAWRASGSVK